MPEDASINAEVSGGAVGVAGAQEVRIGSQTFISNFYSAAPQAEIAKPTGPIPPCPYPGLAYFGPNDASRFFGREQAIQALLLAVAKRSFTALVGASGSGKSSVVLAGLAARLETQGSWRTTYFRIGTELDRNPFAALARALSPLLGGDVVDHLARTEKLTANLIRGEITLPNIVAQCRAVNPGNRIFVIADQFEEVFTLIADEALRNRFIDALIASFPDPVADATPDVCLVLTLRADFYNAALRYRPLADRLQDHVENLGPMNRDELREAIVKPAEAVEVKFEPGLVATILGDVEKRPGSLPLLQFALREMWGRLEKLLMTREDYDAIGGVEGALAKRAQAIFEDATDQGKNGAAVALFRRLFTRLVTLGEGSEDTRRLVSRDELGSDAWSLAQKLADEDNRLVVTAATTPGKETAEVVHEALIRNWSMLVDWVNTDRTFIVWRNHLKLRVDEWRTDPDDNGTLLRGKPLEIAEKWVAERESEINDQERLFVAWSISFRDAEKARTNEELRKQLLRLTERLTIERYDLVDNTKSQVTETLKELRKSLFRNRLILIFLIVSSLTYFNPPFREDDYHFADSMVVCMALTLTTVSPVILKYVTLSRDWFLGDRVVIGDILKFISHFVPMIGKISFRYYVLVGLFSYLIHITVSMYLFTRHSPDLHLMNYSLTPYEIILQSYHTAAAVIIAVGLAVLIDRHLAGLQDMRVTSRVIDGVMLSVAMLIFQIGQPLLPEQLVHRGVEPGIFSAPSLIESVSCAFLIGAYLPVTASRILMQAKHTLDQCSTYLCLLG